MKKEEEHRKKDFTHIFPIIHTNGKTIILDALPDREFNRLVNIYKKCVFYEKLIKVFFPETFF